MIDKIVKPCLCTIHTYKMKKVEAFARIKILNGVLTITGFVGPASHGICEGSAGQCIDEFRDGEPAEEWTLEMLNKFCDIWSKWHLNNMRPYCDHMEGLGWNAHFKDKIKIETWTLTRQYQDLKRKAENRALQCLRDGKPFYPTKDEIAYANMKYSMEVYNDEDKSYNYGKLYRDAYEFRERDCLGRLNSVYRQRNEISYKDHPLGFLKRPCPICRYEYGTYWLKEELPNDVISFILGLPEPKTKPSWI